MEKIWLKHYPVGRPAEINPDEYRSLVELMHDCCRQYGTAPAFTNFGKSIAYCELEALTPPQSLVHNHLPLQNVTSATWL